MTDESADFLKPPAGLRAGVAVAKAQPRIDFLDYPGQDHAGKPWSNWAEGASPAASSTPPNGKGKVVKAGVKANQRLTVEP